MPDLIRRAAHRLRLLLTPGTGKHRRRHRPHLTAAPLSPPPPPLAHLPRPRSSYGLPTPLDGTASPLVRPYLLAQEREAALQQHRRLALVLAADHGIDLDQHLIGAQEAAA